MTDLTNLKTLGVNDLAEVCTEKGIKVTDKDNRDTLLAKLSPAKSKKTK